MPLRCLICALFCCCLLPGPVSAAPTIEVGFSPGGGATASLVRLITEANQSIRIAAYTFTSKDIVTALIDAHNRGVDVKAVLDKSNATAKYTAATSLANVSIPTRIDWHYALMHNKFMVVDGDKVETGSFNYTKAAEDKNAENLIILREYPDISTLYLNRWQDLWNESVDYQPRN